MNSMDKFLMNFKIMIPSLVLVLFLGQSQVKGQTAAEAERLLNRQEYGKAKAMLDKLIAADPKDDKLYYLLGRVHFETDNISLARAAFKKGMDRGGRNPDNYIGMGGILVREDKYDEAKAKLDKAMELNRKGRTDYMIKIASAYLESDKSDYLKQAEYYLYKVLTKEKDNLDAFIGLGDLYDRQNVQQLALNNYEEALKRNPNYRKGLLRKGQILKKMEKYNEAAEAFQNAIKIEPDFPPPYREMAEMWVLAKKYDKALNFFEQYLQMVNNDLSARLRYGLILFLAENYDKAISEMETVLQDTNSLVLLRLLGYSYIEQEDYEKGKNYMDRYFGGVTEKSHIVSDYEYMARYFGGISQDSLAILEYRKAIEKAEKSGTPKPELILKIADIYKASKNYAKQAEILGEYMSKTKQSVKHTFAQGRAYFMAKDYENADVTFEKMINLKDDLHIGYVWRGKSNAAMDPESKEGKAKPFYEKVLEMLSADEAKKAKYKRDFIEANSYLGAFHTLVSLDYGAAIPFWKSILEVDPENKGAGEGLKYCEAKANGG